MHEAFNTHELNDHRQRNHCDQINEGFLKVVSADGHLKADSTMQNSMVRDRLMQAVRQGSCQGWCPVLSDMVT